MASKRVLVTGAAGFIGSHMANFLLHATDWDIIALDKMDYVSNTERLETGDHKRMQVRIHDLADPLGKLEDVDYIIHIAAQSHVDRSISDPYTTVQSNILGTLNLLEYARLCKPERLLYLSTDEVMGPATGTVRYRVTDSAHPENLYAATKLAAEGLITAYACTHGLRAVVARSVNVFGIKQHWEKFIPLCIKAILQGETVYIHADSGRKESGSGIRYYIPVFMLRRILYDLLVSEDTVLLSKDSRYAGMYHVSTEFCLSNIALAKYIAQVIGKPLKYEMVDFHSTRPGHDLRYGIVDTDGKIRRYGLSANRDKMMEELQKTVIWYVNNPKWLGLESGAGAERSSPDTRLVS